jgi:N-acetylmuramoyl-L-alanine amidase
LRFKASIIFCVWLFILLAGGQAVAEAAPKLEIEGLLTKEPPIVVNGRLLVPVRTISEGLGASASWDKQREAVILIDGSRRMELFIGRNTAVIDGAVVRLETPPRIYNGRTYLPVRFIAETLNAKISWDKASETASVFRGICFLNPLEFDPQQGGLLIKISGDKPIRLSQASSANTSKIVFDLPLTNLSTGEEHFSLGIAGVSKISVENSGAEIDSVRISIDGEDMVFRGSRGINSYSLFFPYQVSTIEELTGLPYPSLRLEGNGPISAILTHSTLEYAINFPAAVVSPSLAIPRQLPSPVITIEAKNQEAGSRITLGLREDVHARLVSSSDEKAIVVSFSPLLKNVTAQGRNTSTLLSVSATSGFNNEYDISVSGNKIFFDFKFVRWDWVEKVIPLTGGNVTSVEVLKSPRYPQGFRIIVNAKTPGGYRVLNQGDSGEFVAEIIASPVYGKYIAIDAGHGGNDSGAVSITKKKEKDFNQAVAERLVCLLQDAGAKVLITRPGDTTVSLQERTDNANAAGVDIFVSIHHNSVVNPDIFGTESFFYPGKNESQRLAGAIHRHLVKALNSNDRQVRAKDFFVLRTTLMPAALVEVGYLSNVKDEQAASTMANQEKAAQGIFDGILQYFDPER